MSCKFVRLKQKGALNSDEYTRFTLIHNGYISTPVLLQVTVNIVQSSLFSTSSKNPSENLTICSYAISNPFLAP